VDIRARQQEAVLAFGRRANARPPLVVLMQDAVALVTDVVGADLTGVGKIAQGQTLVLSINRTDGKDLPVKPAVHRCPLASPDSMAAHTLRTASPTRSADLAKETRFADPFLRGLGVRSALCIPLHMNGRPYGTLGVYRTEPKEFDLDDACFAETIAHLLSSSIARIKLEDELQEEREVKNTVLEMADRMVVGLDMDGRVIAMNRASEQVTKFSLDEARRRPFWDLFIGPEDQDLIEGIFRNARASNVPNEFEGDLIAKDGTRRKVTWSLKVMCTGEVQSLILTGVERTGQTETKQEVPMPESLADRTARALEELSEKLKEVTVGVGSASQPTAAPPRASHDDAAMEPPPLPVQPLGEIPGAGGFGIDKRKSVRRQYPYRQWIAPIVNGRVPSRREFFEVRCKDISGSGIAFFLNFLPEFEDLVVGLGRLPALNYFTARVMRVARVEEGDRVGYLVGCRFVGKALLPDAVKGGKQRRTVPSAEAGGPSA
jgi:PAS domain S-box-containing protein